MSRPINDLISLRGRRALITGAASGIGRAMALRFAEAGASLYLVDVNEAGLNEVANEVRGRFGVDVSTYRVDLSRKREIDDLWSAIRGREPDILVNNAGIYEFMDFLEVDEEALERTLAVNLKSVFHMCQGMIRGRGDRGGVIINVGSIESILPFARNLVHYDMSKMGVIALTRALAKEYGPKGFRINVIIAGGINTPGVQRLRQEAILKLRIDVIRTGVEYFMRMPLRRLGDPDEVARVALFLASDMASYVHGAAIPVDGGFLSA
ncbi:SDR family NAD(P)-dependent oxidoreductase [Vulcanisaeta souniana]|uniref:2-deoxy-D-gluconate 3-dehydrogenase n=1 Tax=Vulcanisaeta souniana JCM 11219 TaxID=1293586 RepID=A0A830EFN1_9CREN|nr:SDR family oxidoreductase [Vulcanisaeta souniana]BDR91077.1 2-deoxy-D-gluconate 3-dehydrogenase [Vulcanisaeta souniana JCM 11219]GGI80621.1 2-deoxy-D-gluconate 3-dehydrogenase [Vulcanisaeta souniana JCM 11219]